MDDLMPQKADKKTTKEAAPKPETFTSDYRFASADDIRAVTVNHLAKLEAELHTLRMAYVANGKDPDIPLAPNRPIGGEMVRIKDSINVLSEYFQDILSDPDVR